MSTADTKANTTWGGGALQLLKHAIALDAACDDDGGGDAQPLAREVDLLGRRCALERVDLKRVPVHTAKRGEACSECQRALTEKRTLRGGGAPQLLDLRLFEDGGERCSALGSDVVVPNTASEGQDGNSERVGVSTGADRKANTIGWRRT